MLCHLAIEAMHLCCMSLNVAIAFAALKLEFVCVQVTNACVVFA